MPPYDAETAYAEVVLFRETAQRLALIARRIERKSDDAMNLARHLLSAAEIGSGLSDQRDDRNRPADPLDVGVAWKRDLQLVRELAGVLLDIAP